VKLFDSSSNRQPFQEIASVRLVRELGGHSNPADGPLMAHCSSSSCEIAFAKAAVREGLFRPDSVEKLPRILML
jgi:hypothetical protein